MMLSLQVKSGSRHIPDLESMYVPICYVSAARTCSGALLLPLNVSSSSRSLLEERDTPLKPSLLSARGAEQDVRSVSTRNIACRSSEYHLSCSIRVVSRVPVVLSLSKKIDPKDHSALVPRAGRSWPSENLPRYSLAVFASPRDPGATRNQRR